jgi:serine/threonine protein kinase
MIVFVQYMRAVYYYQSFRIVHRDLKPENFLFFYTNDLNTLTVIDFGISKKYNDGMNSLNSKSGTVSTININNYSKGLLCISRSFRWFLQ